MPQCHERVDCEQPPVGEGVYYMRAQKQLRMIYAHGQLSAISLCACVYVCVCVFVGVRNNNENHKNHSVRNTDHNDNHNIIISRTFIMQQTHLCIHACTFYSDGCVCCSTPIPASQTCMYRIYMYMTMIIIYI